VPVGVPLKIWCSTRGRSIGGFDTQLDGGVERGKKKKSSAREIKEPRKVRAGDGGGRGSAVKELVNLSAPWADYEGESRNWA